MALAEILFLLLLTAVPGKWGWRTFQQASDPALQRLPRAFSIDISSPEQTPEGQRDLVADKLQNDLHFAGALHDQQGLLRVKSIDYREQHNTAADGTRDPGRLRAEFVVATDRPVVGDVRVTITLSADEAVGGSGHIGCTAPESEEGGTRKTRYSDCKATKPSIGVRDRPGNGYSFTVTRDINPSRDGYSVLLDDGPGRLRLSHDQTQLFVQMEIAGVEAIGFVESRTRAETRFPSVTLGGYPPTPGPPRTGTGDAAVAVEARYDITDGSKLTWSRTEPLPDSSRGQLWSYEVGGKEALQPPEGAGGLREDLLAENSQLTFLAGASIGVAGGAAIAAAQKIIRFLPVAASAILTRIRSGRFRRRD
ncbi:hypothetical protein H5U98_25580 [Mycolicibacterium boenickei]|uniref:DUF3068 domain-containing protein n=1 Tax=Mycolicibacterium boenickei TaxID=146017 RepID=A0AAX2ZVD1_9MYCO|nr:hypothetical protein [Mycolicibacterium boenickei]UNB98837.1 hypothetical protein H5U98_25580 [Mycolicibacterium boenickei]BBX88402.1 hypothetical protein MBOE_00510 [Mycolicibacterium boenickei]